MVVSIFHVLGRTTVRAGLKTGPRSALLLESEVCVEVRLAVGKSLTARQTDWSVQAGVHAVFKISRQISAPDVTESEPRLPRVRVENEQKKGRKTTVLSYLPS